MENQIIWVYQKKLPLTSCAVLHSWVEDASKITPSPGEGGFMLPPNTWFLGPPQVHVPNGTLVSSVVLAQLMVVSKRQTLRPRNIGKQ